jgi:hypothetical protein
MKRRNKIFTIIISGILFAYVLFQSYHFDNIFQIFFYIIFGGIGLFILFNGIFPEIEKYKKTKEFKSFSLTFIGIALIILNLGIFSYYEMKLNAQTLLKAKNHGVYADFKKNGEYIILSGSWANKQHFYGVYNLKDSTINMDRNYFDDILVTDKLVIRKIKDAFGENDNGKIRKYLIEINQNGREIDNNCKFEIIEDNRK